MRTFLFSFTLFFSSLNLVAQAPFPYRISLEEVSVPNLPGLHSYAFAQYDGKWVLIGGRIDGLHARQPFNAFPANSNNTEIYVVDIQSKQVWSSSVNSLSTGLKEQLQSTNMNFFQSDSTLYIIGGYAFSVSKNDHMTFPNLTAVSVPGLIDAIMNNASITPYFEQITDTRFAVTGGQLGKIGATFYLVGGHQFDGRYNPMGHSTYTQTYSNQIRSFKINNGQGQLSISDYQSVTDAVHLHRRDYNLLPQIFPDGSKGYTMSSGVFQVTADLPYLYPIDIRASGHQPITDFNQYLSNYHCSSVSLYDSVSNAMHNLFFGGMSQYYYNNGNLIKDNQVPFVNTISRLSRSSDGSLNEYKVNTQMPGLKGSSAEFIPYHDLLDTDFDVIRMDYFEGDSIVLGHIFGGISSSMLNPFNSNQTSNTSADASIFKVTLIYDELASVSKLNGANPHRISVSPNPVREELQVRFDLANDADVDFMISNVSGQVVNKGSFDHCEKGSHSFMINTDSLKDAGTYILTVIFDGRFYTTEKFMKVK
ncbi:MAG: T9SS type A sorting domain-containing protein [Vicingaceae bacterium]